MDILFASSKGSQYRYFKMLCKRLKGYCHLVTLLPTFKMTLSNNGLTHSGILQGIDFHIRRKKQKYVLAKRIPELFWVLYTCRAYLKFTLIYLRFHAYLKEHNPQVVAVWNGHRLPEQAIGLAAKQLGIQMAYFENGLLPNTTTLDFKGVNAFNSVPRDKRFYRDYAAHFGVHSYSSNHLQVRETHKSKRDIKSYALHKIDRYVFAPFQVGFDSQVLINSPVIQSMDQFYEWLECAAYKIEDQNLKIVVKEHPSDPIVYKHLHNRHPNIIFSTESTETLIRGAEAVVTLNSSVGLEALMLEKKVVVAGNACYRVSGISKSVSSANELADTLASLDSWEPNITLQRAFMTYLMNDYCISGAWQKYEKEPGDSHDEHVVAIQERLFSGICEQEVYLKHRNYKAFAS